MRLTITPPYLDLTSHEALYEIDLTVLEAGRQEKPGLDKPDKIVPAAGARVEGVSACTREASAVSWM